MSNNIELEESKTTPNKYKRHPSDNNSNTDLRECEKKKENWAGQISLSLLLSGEGKEGVCVAQVAIFDTAGICGKG